MSASRSPTLWINDVTYAPLIAQTGWPSLYDVTDDWLLAPAPPRERERLRRLDELALAQADEVVVCSPALAASRGAKRTVTLIPNGVDVEHFRRPRPRPADLPAAPTAVYWGRCTTLASTSSSSSSSPMLCRELNLVFVGPNSLGAASHGCWKRFRTSSCSGRGRTATLPAYLQHADVVIVPHRGLGLLRDPRSDQGLRVPGDRTPDGGNSRRGLSRT